MDIIQVPAGGGGGAGGPAAAVGGPAPVAEKEEEKEEEKVCVRLYNPDGSRVEQLPHPGGVRRGYGLRTVRLETFQCMIGVANSIRATYLLFCNPIGVPELRTCLSAEDGSTARGW